MKITFPTNLNAESYKWKYCKVLGMHQFLTKCTRKYSSWVLPTVSSEVSNLRHGTHSIFGYALVSTVLVSETNCLNVKKIQL